MEPSSQEKMFAIKDVAEQTGLAPSTIRFYDQQFEEYLGIKRGAGRRRMFPPESVERLRLVHRMLKQDGLSIRQVRQALSGGEPFSAAGEDQSLKAEVKALKAELENVKAQIQQLKDIQARTLALVDTLTS